MAIVHCCDRCGRATALKPAFNATAELCAACSTAFDAWWTAGQRKGARARATIKTRVLLPPGRPYEVACELIAKYGAVTPELFAQRTGQDYRAAYLSLRHLRRTGVLQGGFRKGMGVRLYMAEPVMERGAAE